MVRRASRACLLVFLLAAAGGCGALSKRDYIERANAICRRMNAQEARLDAIDALHDVRSYARTGASVVTLDQRSRERLGRLRAPNELKDRMRSFLVALDRRLERQRRAVNAARRGDVATVVAMKFEREPPAERQAAARIGLTACGRR
ncbi:MAG: hypothetical protein QOK04_2127 [Solirubrobacteraceae bacterium]|jgi:DNA repair ATPase RecN|nr:hypothetical protein [Solirubrobacteraceae bacterium]